MNFSQDLHIHIAGTKGTPQNHMNEFNEELNEDTCIHCSGTGVFVRNAGSVDEVDVKCVCQVIEDFEREDVPYRFAPEFDHA